MKIDLQEIVRTTFGQGNPTPCFYVSVEDARTLIDEIERLTAIADRLPKDALGNPISVGDTVTLAADNRQVGVAAVSISRNSAVWGETVNGPWYRGNECTIEKVRD